MTMIKIIIAIGLYLTITVPVHGAFNIPVILSGLPTNQIYKTTATTTPNLIIINK